MNDPKLTIGAHQYEHTTALFDGTATINGVDATFTTAPIVSGIFQRMVRGTSTSRNWD